MDKAATIRDLLSVRISWIKETGRPRWRASYDSDVCELTMNDFPDEPLYTLTWRGQVIDLND